MNIDELSRVTGIRKSILRFAIKMENSFKLGEPTKLMNAEPNALIPILKINIEELDQEIRRKNSKDIIGTCTEISTIAMVIANRYHQPSKVNYEPKLLESRNFPGISYCLIPDGVLKATFVEDGLMECKLSSSVTVTIRTIPGEVLFIATGTDNQRWGSLAGRRMLFHRDFNGKLFQWSRKASIKSLYESEGLDENKAYAVIKTYRKKI